MTQTTPVYDIAYADTGDPSSLQTITSVLAQSVEAALVEAVGPDNISATFTLAIPSTSPGWIGSMQLVRYGRIVQMSLEATGLWNNNAWNNTPSVTIPADYRPTRTVVQSGLFFNPSGGALLHPGIPARIQILPSGVFTIGVGGISGNTGVRFSSVWIVED